ncbi:YjgN family protein [uncultured Sphingomonas sp.]|uniref:YjgN family protein n=1 Tax=uncultured Sphingomonas sp. TaxID=158754 RepID=UPI0035CC2BBE
MTDEAPRGDTAGGSRAFGFTGTWQEYGPIAFTNLLLTIVTLGIYTFWARTRTRRYLWSQTRFIDDRLEWTGTGLELFIGYMLAIVFFAVPFAIINLVLQGVLLRGHAGFAALIVGALYLLLLYLIGVAIFRALRYRLTRTYWHGIRGGSDDAGFRYGVSYFWRTLLGSAALGLMIPWSMTTLWNKRWSAMSFGSSSFHAQAEWKPIFPRFLLFYIAPIAMIVIVAIFAGAAAGLGSLTSFPTSPGPGTIATFVIVALMFYLLFFGVLGLIAMIYYSAFFREAVGALTLGKLSFSFDATTMDWVKLYLGNLALVVLTLGIGLIFVPYRNWAFFIRHMEAFGDVVLDDFTQSTTRTPRQGEGLLDAFDVGAF